MQFVVPLSTPFSRKFGQKISQVIGPEPDEDDQLENPPAISVRTAIRNALDFAQAGLEPIEAALLEIEKLAAGDT